MGTRIFVYSILWFMASFAGRTNNEGLLWYTVAVSFIIYVMIYPIYSYIPKSEDEDD